MVEAVGKEGACGSGSVETVGAMRKWSKQCGGEVVGRMGGGGEERVCTWGWSADSDGM